MAQMHTCSICGKTDKWGASWAWFGSYRQLDDGDPIAKLCSDKCKAEFESRAAELRDREKALKREAEKMGIDL